MNQILYNAGRILLGVSAGIFIVLSLLTVAGAILIWANGGVV